MSKVVLISLRPEWCEKIINGQKTTEVRKTHPNMNPPFKCYIYECGNGKVIGEFTCNRVTNLFSNSRFWLDEGDVLHTCLSAAEMRKYANGARGLYGWHISDLRVYDHPRDLWEFTGLRETKFGLAPGPITRPPQSWRYVEKELWND